MQKKLYIPTSTLNFNNIISSESISPYSFYNLRGYGFKHFVKVNCNSLDNVILLYENFPVFEIEDKELENYPMVIEICVDSCLVKLEQVGRGIYACNETIYLNPFDTRILFGSYQELIKTKSKAEPSIEAKLAKLYDECYEVVDKSITKKRYITESIKDNEINLTALDKDVRINKLKGFLYSYIIAANRSYDSNVVNLKMHVRQLLNTLSAVVISPQFTDNDLSSNINLEHCYRLIAYDIERIEGISDIVDKIIEEKKNYYEVSNLVDILKEEGLYESWRIKIKNKNNLRIKNEVTRFSIPFGSDKLSLLNNYSEYLDTIISKLDKKVDNISLEKLPVISEYKIVNIPDQKDFIVNFLNVFLHDKIQKDSFLTHRYDYARKGGALFKDVLAEKWEGSEEKIYINALLKNLNEYSAFDINSVTNPRLKSYAAFFQKGDIEIEKLEDYLVANGIGDLKLAFALWGVVFGFAEMPKTITKDLFDSNDEVYKTSIYKSVYKSIHGVDLVGELFKGRNFNVDLRNADDKTETKTLWEKFKERGEEWIKTIKGDIVDKEYLGDMPKCLEMIFSSSDFANIKKDAQVWYKEESLKLWNKYQANSVEFQKELLQLKELCRVSGTKGKWEKLVKSIIFSKKQVKRENNDNVLHLDFEKGQSKISSSGVFLDDYDYLISDFRFIKEAEKCDRNWVKDLKWFIDAHDPKHPGYEKYYKGKSRDNRDVIRSFLNFRQRKYSALESLLNLIYRL